MMTTCELAGRVAAQVEAGRVEHVAEDAQVGDQGDAPAVRVVTIEPKVLRGSHRRCRPQAAGRWSLSRKVTRFGRFRPTSRMRRGDLVQLGQVEREVVDVVLQLVRERAVRGGGAPCPRGDGTSCGTLQRGRRAAPRPPRTRTGSRPRGSRSPGGRPHTRCRAGPGARPGRRCASSVRNVYFGWLKVALDDDPFRPNTGTRVHRHAVRASGRGSTAAGSCGRSSSACRGSVRQLAVSTFHEARA